MRKGYELIGLRVIGVQDVTDLGKVIDLIFDQTADQCLGLVMSEGGLMSEAQVVPWSEIRTVGPDAIMVNASTSKVGVSGAPDLQAAMNADTSLSGDRLMTTGGNALGTLGDVYLDETTGRVQGYEVSGGLVSDVSSGKNYLPADAIPQVGRDTILVAPHVEGMLQEQNETSSSGLKGVAQSASDKLSVAGDKLASAYESVKDKATETYANIASASVDKQKEFVVGKVAGQDVYLPLGSTLPSGLTTATTPTPALSAATGNAALNEADLMDRDLDVETISLPREGTIGTHAPDIAPTSATPTPSFLGIPDVSAPGLNFNEVEPATILDPMGEKATAAGESVGSSLPYSSGTSAPSTAANFDPATVSAPGLNFNEVEPATILDPMGQKAEAAGEQVGSTLHATGSTYASSAPIQFDPNAVSAPGLNFNEVEPATILDPMGERASQSGAMQSALVPASTAHTTSTSDTAEHGPLLVAKGQTITQQQADTAENAGILHQLLLAVGSGAVAGASDAVHDRTSDVSNGGQGQSGVSNAGAQASQLLSSAKEKGSQLLSAAQERKAQLDDANLRKRINHALGRPVTRVILAKDDTVILNVGDLITNKAVGMAYDNGALETLLSSVYDEEPQITPAMARTTEAGTATIPSQAPLMPPPATAIAPPEQNDQSQPPQGNPGQSGQSQGGQSQGS